MAQGMVLGLGLLEPQDSRAARVWKNVTAKFASGHVPHEQIGFFFALSALRMGQRTFSDIGYVMMLMNKMHQNWLHESGLLTRTVVLRYPPRNGDCWSSARMVAGHVV